MNKQVLDEEFDRLPCTLKSTQEWFASVITNRLGKNDVIQTYTASGGLIAEEAARYIVPNHSLRPDQRIQIYNQQYWWRLLNTLHSNFPLVTRLFGSLAFNEEIGIPYLLKYPPNHWSLTLLGERLPKWITEYYHEPDRSLLYNAASLDWAFMASFIAAQLPPLDLAHLQGDPESLLSFTFYLQPHIHLFKWEYDLLIFREYFLKQGVDYWVEHRFPDLPKGRTYRFVLYRNANNNIAWREISQGEFLLLERFKTGTTISTTCEFIETQEASLYEEVEANLQKWLQEWTQAGWLTLTSKEEG
jgi:Putative DNA-binding domain